MVNVQFHTPYIPDVSPAQRYHVAWPVGWPVPRAGDEVVSHEGVTLHVRHVAWYPHGEDGSDPFVYVVLAGRPRWVDKETVARP